MRADENWFRVRIGPVAANEDIADDVLGYASRHAQPVEARLCPRREERAGLAFLR